MRQHLVLLLALTMATSFAAVADQNILAVPDTGCQSATDWRLHDYLPPAPGNLLIGPSNGNMNPCPSGNVWDGDNEWATGGAVLVSRSGDGATDGGIACYNTEGHHPEDGTVAVTDLSGLPTFFAVAADAADPLVPPNTPDCGDGVIDPCNASPPPSSLPPPVGGAVDAVHALVASLFTGISPGCTTGDVLKHCLASCAVDFPPGADGAYVVFVGPPLTSQPSLAVGGHVFL